MIVIYIMNKVIGYGVSIVGIVVMALGFDLLGFNVAFLEGVASNYIAGAGIVLIVIGVVLAMKGSGGGKIKRAAEEIPIYEGVGKKRKIVGYRKD